MITRTNFFIIQGRTLTDLFFLRFLRLLLKNNKNKAISRIVVHFVCRRKLCVCFEKSADILG